MEAHVPANYLLRSIDRFVEFEGVWLGDRLAWWSCDRGSPLAVVATATQQTLWFPQPSGKSGRDSVPVIVVNVMLEAV